MTTLTGRPGEDEVKEVDILVSEKTAEVLLLEENKDTAIIDTGCARSTSGEDWIKAHLENLSQEDRLDINRKEGKSYFRFGNGKSSKSKSNQLYHAWSYSVIS